MKKFLLAASAFVSAAAIAGAASAADLEPAPAPMYDWSGFYFGLNAGVAWNNTEIDSDLTYDGALPDVGIDEAAALANLADSLTGDDAVFTGGAMIGYNWQMESLVLGVEADINYLGFGADQDNDYAFDNVGGDDYVVSHDLSFDANWFGTLRGRLGFEADNFLFYGTGGLAYGHMEAESDFRISQNGSEIGRWDNSADDVNWGWTIGAGMEYGIENWSLGIEYLYVDLGSADWDADFEGPQSNVDDILDNASLEGSVDYQFSVVRATAKLRF